MAAITNTFVSTSASGNREELSDVVTRITPEEAAQEILLYLGQQGSI